MTVDELEIGFRQALQAVFSADAVAQRRERRRRVWRGNAGLAAAADD